MISALRPMLVFVAFAAIAAPHALRTPASTVNRQAPQHRPAVAMCFAPDTDPAYIAAVQQDLLDKMGATLEYNTTARWPGAVGTPVSLTYSFVPDGVETGQGPNQLFELMNQADFGGDVDMNGKPDWQDLFRQMFDRWTEVTGNTYTEVSDDGAPWPTSSGSPGVRGDIRIVCAPNDGQGNIWAFNYFPGQIQAGDMLIDAADVFTIDLPTNNFRRFRNLIGHEHGHGQGLLHVCPDSTQSGGASKLMEPFIVSSYDGPQLDDILGSQALYGDRFEPNNSIAAAEPLESIGLESGVELVVSDISAHSITDADLFSFEAESGSMVMNIQVASQGFSYLEGDQIGGVCQAGSLVNALEYADLQLELLNPSGAVIASSNAQGLGGIEEINSTILPVDGEYTIRVRTSGPTFAGVQLYRLRATIELAGIPGDFNGDGAVDGTDLAILLSVWGTPGAGTGADLNGDGVVNGADLAALLASWTG